jgi:hypothetical protein
MATNDQIIKDLTDLQMAFDDTRDRLSRVAQSVPQAASQSYRTIKSIATSVNNSLKQTLDLEAKLGTEFIRHRNIQRELDVSKAKEVSLLQQIEEHSTRNNSTLKNQLDTILNSGQDQAEIQKDLNMLAEQALILAQHNSTEQNLHAAMLTEIFAKNRNILNVQEDQEKRVLAANKEYGKLLIKMGIIDKLIKGVSKIPIFGDLMNLKAIRDDMENVARTAGSTKFDVFTQGIISTGEQLKQSFNDPLVSITAISTTFSFLWKGMMKLNESVVEMSNNMGVSNDFARRIQVSFNAMQLSANDSFVNTQNLGNALSSLQGVLQTNAMFTAQQLKDQIDMTEKMGLTAEEAGNIQKMSLLTGKSASDLMQTTLKMNRTSVAYKKIMKDVSNIGGETFAKYKGNVEQITQAVVQANKLGFTMEQAAKAADGLLDFESSISNELEAELLTGRQLNLERARSLALDGKDSQAVAEISKQFGGIDKLMSLNVIQRKSLASLLGMSSDEMMEMMKNQKLFNDLGVQDREELQKKYETIKNGEEKRQFEQEILKKQNGQILLQDIQKVTIQKQFEQSMLKLQQILIQITSGPLMRLAEGFANILSDAQKLKLVAVGIATLMGGLMGAAFGPAGIAIGGIAAGAFAASRINGAEEAIPDGNRHADGGIAVRKHVGMIGEAGPEAIIPLNKQNIFDIKGMSKLIEQNEVVVSQNKQMIELLQRGGTLIMDSVKVGTAQGISYNSFA